MKFLTIIDENTRQEVVVNPLQIKYVERLRGEEAVRITLNFGSGLFDSDTEICAKGSLTDWKTKINEALNG